MARLSGIEAAQRLALAGKVEAAVVDLRALKTDGDVGACASLAEICAYQGQWQEVLENLKSVFTAPSKLSTFNVYSDMCLLAARAGGVVKDWPAIQALAELAGSKLTADSSDQARVSAIRKLAEFATRKGAPPSLTEVTEPEDQRKRKFDAAVEKMVKTKMKFRTASDRLDHLFGLARTYRYHPGAVAAYDEERALPNIFENAAFAASGLARIARQDEAWKVILESIRRWWPVAQTQIAPVYLLTDDALIPVMTPERCNKVLRTARGPAAG